MGGCGSSDKKVNRDTLHKPQFGDMGSEEKEIKMKMCIAGEVGVGKSLFYHTYFGTLERFKNVSTPASGDNSVKRLEIPGHGRVMLSIWDTAGQENYKSVTQIFFRGANGVIVLFDVTRKDSLSKIEEGWLETFKKNLDMSKAVICLVANKIDLPDRLVTKEEAEQFAGKHGMMYFEASALQKIGVTESIDAAVAKILQVGV